MEHLHRESFFLDLTNSDDKSATFTKLISLSLDDNRLATLHDDQFKMLTHLLSIDIMDNMLTVIETNTFKYNIKLTSINLSNNLISDFNFNLIDLPFLNSLTLDANKLTTLKEDVFDAFFYFYDDAPWFQRILSIKDNYLTCDCLMFWIISYPISSSVFVNTEEICSSHISNISLSCFFNSEDAAHYIKNCTTLNNTLCPES